MADLELRRTASEEVFRKGRSGLCLDTFVDEDGREYGPYLVLEFPDWVNVVALTRDTQVVLVRQPRAGSGRVTLELPGGTVEDDDTSPEETMRRELAEETGYGGGRFIYLGDFSPNSANHANRVHSFLALDVEPLGEAHPDDGELVEPLLMPLDEVIRTARAGGMDQLMHVGTLFLALAHLGRVAA